MLGFSNLNLFDFAAPKAEIVAGRTEHSMQPRVDSCSCSCSDIVVVATGCDKILWEMQARVKS